jgi:hypothetical protein
MKSSFLCLAMLPAVVALVKFTAGVVVDLTPGAATRSRMTNGSVSRPAAQPRSRVTNGVTQEANQTTLIVNYQDGSKTTTVPANVPAVEVAATILTPKAGPPDRRSRKPTDARVND